MDQNNKSILAINDWMQFFEEEDLVLSFKGEFNRDLINAILILSSGKNQLNDNNAVVKNRIFSIIVECTQNICKHGADDIKNSEIKPGIILIGKEGKTPVISTGNLMHTSEVDLLKQNIEGLKKLSKEEMKAHAKNVMVTGTLSAKSGAGLGLITIMRKSEKLEYEIRKINDELSFFALQVHVSTSSNN
jgi:hypothetical protein